MILAIDPSYSSTGVAILDGDKLVDYTTIKSPGDCYKSPAACDSAAISIVQQLLEYIQKFSIASIIIEVPALQSKTGGYLAILHGMLVLSLRRVACIYLVSCKSCDSRIGNRAHSKSYIVKYCKDHGWVPDKRINNDVCTAVVLGHILLDIKQGVWKNQYSVV